MKKITAVILLYAAFATPAFAEGFFIGGDIGIASGYPDRTAEVGNALIGGGATYVSVTQKKSSVAYDLRLGQWVTEHFGWELGYDRLGSVDGTWTTTGATTNGSYKYTASASHLAVLGGIPLGGRSKLYGKVGLFSGSTKEDWSSSNGNISSKTQSSSGLLLGGGYEQSFNDHLAGHVGLNLFNGMKFYDFAKNTTATDKKTLVQLAVGVDYKF